MKPARIFHWKSAMFKLSPDEKIINSFSPLNSRGHLKTCALCSQIAFRVLRIQSPSEEREIGLCGAHFKEAGIIYPDVRKPQ